MFIWRLLWSTTIFGDTHPQDAQRVATLQEIQEYHVYTIYDFKKTKWPLSVRTESGLILECTECCFYPVTGLEINEADVRLARSTTIEAQALRSGP
jgi:hypothetical protein